MTNLYNGYIESESTKGQRAFSRQMEAQGHKIQRSTSTLLNTEAEVDRLHDFIVCAEMNDLHPVEAAQQIERAMETDVIGEWLDGLNQVERDFIGWVVSDEQTDATLHAEDFDSTPTPSDMPVINFDDVQEVEY